jgi:hypothetical protein
MKLILKYIKKKTIPYAKTKTKQPCKVTNTCTFKKKTTSRICTSLRIANKTKTAQIKRPMQRQYKLTLAFTFLSKMKIKHKSMNNIIMPTPP